jgi:hypothetical protein
MYNDPLWFVASITQSRSPVFKLRHPNTVQMAATPAEAAGYLLE